MIEEGTIVGPMGWKIRNTINSKEMETIEEPTVSDIRKYCEMCGFGKVKVTKKDTINRTMEIAPVDISA